MTSRVFTSITPHTSILDLKNLRRQRQTPCLTHPTTFRQRYTTSKKVKPIQSHSSPASILPLSPTVASMLGWLSRALFVVCSVVLAGSIVGPALSPDFICCLRWLTGFLHRHRRLPGLLSSEPIERILTEYRLMDSFPDRLFHVRWGPFLGKGVRQSVHS